MDIHLRQDEAFLLGGDARGITLFCLAGALWVTIEGDPRDHLLYPGQHLKVGQKGAVVIEARRNAALQIEKLETTKGEAWMSPCLHAH